MPENLRCAWVAGLPGRQLAVVRTGAVVLYERGRVGLRLAQTYLLSPLTQARRTDASDIHLSTREKTLRLRLERKELVSDLLNAILDSRKKETIRQKSRLAQMQQGLPCVKTSHCSTKVVKLRLSPSGNDLHWQGRKTKPKQVPIAGFTCMQLTQASGLRLRVGKRWKEFLLPDASIVTWYMGLQLLGIPTVSPLSHSQCLIKKAVFRLKRESGKRDFGRFLLNLLFSRPKSRPSLPPLSTECSSSASRSSHHFDLPLSDCDISDQEESIPEPLTSPSNRSLKRRCVTERNTQEEGKMNQLIELVTALIRENQIQRNEVVRLNKENKLMRTRLKAVVLHRKTEELREDLQSLRRETQRQYTDLVEVWPHVMQLIQQHLEQLE